jgi:hypothetical protein
VDKALHISVVIPVYKAETCLEELYRRLSSISAANIPVLNLYSPLGFRFKNPKDIHHMVVKL